MPPPQYEEQLSEDENIYDYDIANPRSKSTWWQVLAKTMFIVLICGSLGMAGLYVQNPKQFWATVDVADQYLKPVGSNIIWPDFQVGM